MGFLKRLFSTEKFNTSKESKTARRSYGEIRLNDDLTLIKDFCACVNGEMNLRSGQKARFIYEDNDWFYVESRRGEKGFVPKSYFRGQVRQGVTRISSYNSNHERELAFDDDSEDSLENFCENEGISEDEIDDLFITANNAYENIPATQTDAVDSRIFGPLKDAYLSVTSGSGDCLPTMTSTPRKSPASVGVKSSRKLSTFTSLVDLHNLLHDESQILYFV